MLNTALLKGIQFIHSQQQPNGSFLTLYSDDPHTFRCSQKLPDVFTTALVLNCLNSLDSTPLLEEIKKNAAVFLLSQKSEWWSFNYWDRASLEYQKYSCPDDLDDTFCGLSALYAYNPTLIDENSLVKITTLLTTLESTLGGPYRTWIVNADADEVWKDIDLAVNSNVAFFLSLLDIHLPKLMKYLKSKVNQDQVFSPYYPTVFPLIYYISRVHQDKKLKSILLNQLSNNKCWDNQLHTALAVSSCINLKMPVTVIADSVSHLVNTQTAGKWDPSPFYIGASLKNSSPAYSGSAVLTTAFCLESLAKYQRYQNELSYSDPSTDGVEVIYKDKIQAYNNILNKVSARFKNFDQRFTSTASSLTTRILKKDKTHQITLLPYYFAQSLKNNTAISNDLIIELGVANLYGWIAYTIYDDMYDNEGSTTLLPIAHICSRELTRIFIFVVDSDEFIWLFNNVMTNLDYANWWEMQYSQIPIEDNQLLIGNFNAIDFNSFLEKLADKSLGHALGPLAILFSLGYTKQSPEIQYLIDFFRNYLIIKQLNDDAHDWEQDMRKGRITPIVSILIQNYLLENPELAISLNQTMSKFKQRFWIDQLPYICTLIIEYSQKARENLLKLGTILDITYLESLLIPIEQSAQQAIMEQKQALKFLDKYDTFILSCESIIVLDR